MSQTLGTGRIRENLDLKWCCDVCGKSRNGNTHTKCAKVRQQRYAKGGRA